MVIRTAAAHKGKRNSQPLWVNDKQCWVIDCGHTFRRLDIPACNSSTSTLALNPFDADSIIDPDASFSHDNTMEKP